MSISAYIGLGANLGDREAALRSALSALSAEAAVTVSAVSALYETAPVGGPGGQGAYLNAAARLETTRPPHDLLDLLLDVEARHHRTRDVRWGPRTLDLDLLLYGDRIIDDARLVVPHPRMSDRGFVLAPLADIAADVTPPGGDQTVAETLAALSVAEDEVWRISSAWTKLNGEKTA